MTKSHWPHVMNTTNQTFQDDEGEKSKIITKMRLGNLQGQTDHPLFEDDGIVRE